MPPIQQPNMYTQPKKSKRLLVVIITAIPLLIAVITVGILLITKTTNQPALQESSSVPQTPTVSYATTIQIIFSWPKVKQATGYVLECSKDKKFVTITITTTSMIPNGSCSSLTPDTVYYARVKSILSSGDSDWSKIASQSTSAQLKIPTNLKLTQLDGATVNYSWDSIDGAKSYDIQWATDQNFLQNVTNITTSKNNGTSTNLKAKTMYYYRVRITPNPGTVLPYSASQSISIL